MVSSYLFALILGPATYGVWQTAKVFLNYGSFTSLGVPFAMRRDFITLRAEGKTEKANRLAHVAFTFNVFINPLIALVFIIIALTSASDLAFRISLLVVGIMYVTTIFSGIGELLHRGINDYRTIGIGNIIYGVGTLAIVPLVLYYGYYALLAGYLALSIVKSCYFYYKRPLNYELTIDFPLLRRMIAIGFPLFLVTLTTVLFSTIDRLLIAAMLDFSSVGYYSLSAFLAQPLTMLLASFSVVIFTHLNEKYGSRRDSIVIERQTYIPQRLLSRALSPIIGVAVIILPIATEILLPQYTDGVKAAQINIFAILFFKLASFSSSGLFILDKQKYTAILFFICGIIKAAGSFWALKSGYGIEGVALFSIVAYLIYHIVMLYQVNRCLGGRVYQFWSRIHESLLPPLTTLFLTIAYTVFAPAIFKELNIMTPWHRLLIGVLYISIGGSYFSLVAFREFKHYYKRKPIS